MQHVLETVTITITETMEDGKKEITRLWMASSRTEGKIFCKPNYKTKKKKQNRAKKKGMVKTKVR